MSKEKKTRNMNMWKLYHESQKTDKPLSFDTIGKKYRVNGERVRIIVRAIDEKRRFQHSK